MEENSHAYIVRAAACMASKWLAITWSLGDQRLLEDALITVFKDENEPLCATASPSKGLSATFPAR